MSLQKNNRFKVDRMVSPGIEPFILVTIERPDGSRSLSSYVPDRQLAQLVDVLIAHLAASKAVSNA
jgi:hypothetical protein